MATSSYTGLNSLPSPISMSSQFKSQPRLYHAALLLLFHYVSLFLPAAILFDMYVAHFNEDDPSNACQSVEDLKTKACRLAISKTMIVNGIVMAAQSVFQFFGAPVCGIVSDWYGRKPILIASMSILTAISLALIGFVNDIVPLWVYFALKIVSGGVDCMSASLAYVADISNPHDRSFRFGLLLSSLSFSLIFAPFAGTMMPREVLLIASFFFSLASIFWAIWIPESLALSKRNPFTKENLNAFRCFEILNRTKMFRRLAVCLFLVTLVIDGVFSCLILYFKQMLGISQKMQAGLLMVWGLSGLFSQTVVLKLLLLIGNNRLVFRFGLILCTVASGMYAAIYESWQILAVTPFFSMAMLLFPASATLKSTNVRETEQGLIQGALMGVRALAGAIGPVFFTVLYTHTNDSSTALWFQPASPFYAGMLCGACATVIGFSVPTRLSPEEQIWLQNNTAVRYHGEKQAFSAVTPGGDVDETWLLSRSTGIVDPFEP